MKLFEHWEVKWGIQPCAGQEECGAMAELLYDGQPLCIRCADLLLERQNVMGENPQLAQMLPELWEHAPDFDAIDVARNR